MILSKFARRMMEVYLILLKHQQAINQEESLKWSGSSITIRKKLSFEEECFHLFKLQKGAPNCY